jgi:hypothetical protein
MGRSRRAGARKRAASHGNHGLGSRWAASRRSYRTLVIDPLECRTLLTATMNVRFEVDAPGPVASLSAGENFTLKAFVQDARADAHGVFQAYFNLAYDASTFNVAGPITHGADLSAVPSGSTTTAGLLQDVGGVDTDQIPPSPAGLEELLFSVPMHAIQGGSFNLAPSLSNDPTKDVLVFDSASGVPLSSIAFSGLPVPVASAPSVSSISPADANPTNAAVVHYTVNFSGPVSGVDATDFALAATGVSGSTIADVSPKSGLNSSYTVTVNAGTVAGASGTLGLNLIDGDAISDASGNTLAGGHSSATIFTGTPLYTVDRTPPSVTAIGLADPSPTSAGAVHYNITFSESVSGVDLSDFSLVPSGVSGATITNVSGSGANWVVTAGTGTGNGTLGLNFVNGDVVTDTAGNTLAGGHNGTNILTGQSYTIQKTPPAVNSITLASANPTNAATVGFTVTFNEPVISVNLSDFALSASGVSGASITGVSGSGATWTVTANTGTGNGTLGLNLIDGDAISDAAGNTLAGGHTPTVLFPGATPYTVDKTAPAVSAITLADPTPTGAAVVHFTVTFSESVTGADSSDFALVATGVSGAAISNVSGSGTTWTVTATTGSGNGTLGLNFVNGHAVTDAAGNTLAGGNSGTLLFTGTSSYTIDKTAPSVSGIALADPSPASAGTVHYNVTFKESVSGVDQSDFSLVSSGVSGATITNVSGSGANWVVTASTGTGNGTLGLNFVNGDAVTDAAGNTLAGAHSGASIFTGQSYTIQKTAPAVNSITLASANPTNAASVQYGVTFSEAVSGVDASDFALVASGVTGATISNVTGSGANWTVTASTGTGDGTLGLNFVDGDTISDAAGNTLAGGKTGATIFASPTPYTIDKTPPTVSAIALADPTPTSAATVHFTVTFSESVTGADSSDFALAATGVTGAAISNVSGSGTTWTVTATTGSGNGTLGLNFVDGDTISDAAGNTVAGGKSGATIFASPTPYTIDKTPPTVASIALADTTPTHAGAVHFTVTFSKSVTSVDLSDFALVASGVSGAAISNVTGSGATWTVTASTGTGDGTLGLNLIDGDAIADAAGNVLAGGHTPTAIFTGPNSYSIDKTPPAVSSITLTDPSPTKASTVRFTVTMSESVSGIDASDFAPATTGGITGASIASVSGTGDTFTVTVNTGTGDGTLGLNLVDGNEISDAAGNTIAGTHTSNVLFTGPSLYTIDKTAPAVSAVSLADASPTHSASVHYTVKFSESVTGVDVSDFALVPNGGVTGATITSVVGGGDTWAVTVATGSGDGSLGLNVIDGDAISDAAGNPLAGGHTNNVIFTGATTYTIDKTPPTVTAIAPADANPTAAATLHFAVTLSESVTGLDASDFALVAGGGVTGATIGSVIGSGANWTVTVNSGTGDGTLGLNLIDGDAIADTAGNVLAGGHTNSVIFTGQSYTLDRSLPTVNSIAPADASPSRAATVHFAVTFNQSVTGVDTTDFALTSGGALSGAAITGVSGSGADWTVTVDTGSGDGTLGLNLIDGNLISAGAGKTLAGGHTGNVIFAGAPPYTIDKTAPAATAIAPADANPTSAALVHFTVTFSEPVSGVDSTDFALAPGGGISGASIASVTGSGATWTVTVNTGSGNGTLGLNLIDGDAISDAAGNILAGANTGTTIFTSATPYTIDRTAPVVSSIALADNSPTNATTVHFTVAFSKSVTGVDESDFALVAGSVSGAAITNVTGSGTTWTVTATTGSGDGTLGLDLINGDAITDTAGNTLAGDHTGATIFAGPTAYAIDKTPPSVSLIALGDASPTNATTVHFAVAFSEAVTGVDTSDFALVAGAGLSGATITGVTGSGTSWTVTANTGTGNGTLSLNFVNGDAVSDAAGNTLAGAHTGATIFPGASAYTIDKTAAVINSITPADANPTKAATLHYAVTFSESVTGVDASDFALVATGLTGASIAGVTGSGANWIVTVNAGTGDGTLGLNLIDGDAISDTAGNTLAGGHTPTILFTGQPVYTIDHTPPSVASIALADPNPTHAATVHFTVTFSDSVTGVDTTDFALAATGVSGAAISNVTGSGTTWTVTATTGAGEGTLSLNFINGDAVSDAAGNTLAGANTGSTIFSGTAAYTIDKTPPAVSAIALVDPTPTNATTVHYSVTFSEAVSGVDPTDFALVASGVTGATITNVNGSGTTWTVTANTGTGNGTLGLNFINGDAVSDVAGNTLAGGRNGVTIFAGTTLYTIDKTAPAISSIVPADTSPTNAATVHFTVTFSKSVTGVDVSDFALATTAGISGATIAGVTGSGTTWNVAVSTGTGSGTLGLNLIDGNAIADTAGNTLAGGHTSVVLFTGQPLYTIDKTPPTVISINPAGANPTSTGAAAFTVTFSENVTGVDASDFALTTGGSVTGAAISGVTGSGAVWTVTVSTGTGDGSLTLNLIDGDAITDTAGNTLAGGHTGATIFTGQTSETIDKTAPSVTAITLPDTNPANAPTTVHFAVTFSESVTGLNASDFSLVTTGLTGSAITGVSGSGATWTVAVATGTGNGTLGLKLIDGDAISDAAGNKLAGGHTGATLFTAPSAYNVLTLTLQSISVTGIAVVVNPGVVVSNAQVATFTAVGGSQNAADFSATITWGDGSSSAGTVSSTSNGFSVTGSHSYVSPGERSLKITVQSGSVTSQGVTTATLGSDNERFIAQVYRDLLHREVEPQGLQFWTSFIAAGNSRQQTVANIIGSPEYRGDVVDGLYQLLLHRSAEPAAVAVDSAYLANGGKAEQLAVMLAASPEYFQARGGSTGPGFLHSLYNDALNRDIDAASLQVAAPLDFNNAAYRTAVAQTVFGSDEYLNDLVSYPGSNSNPFHNELPLGFYQDFLGRNADAATIAQDVSQLKGGTYDNVIIAQILGSDEYFNRAGSLPG